MGIGSSNSSSGPDLLGGCRRQADLTIRLSGTGGGKKEESIVVALARLGGQPCVLIGHDHADIAITPAALRQARRGMYLAQGLELPLVSVIDTAGAELSSRADEGALAGEIARCLATLTTMDVPTISVLLGR